MISPCALESRGYSFNISPVLQPLWPSLTEAITESALIPAIRAYLVTDSLMEISQQHETYSAVVGLLKEASCGPLAPLFFLRNVECKSMGIPVPASVLNMEDKKEDLPLLL